MAALASWRWKFGGTLDLSVERQGNDVQVIDFFLLLCSLDGVHECEDGTVACGHHWSTVQVLEVSAKCGTAAEVKVHHP